jgi:hypothetical protein
LKTGERKPRKQSIAMTPFVHSACIPAPRLKKCRSLKTFADILITTNDAYSDDSCIPVCRMPLPPPKPFVKPSLPTQLSATVANQAPHKILAASCELCRMLDLSMTEMQDRSLHMLFGPDTDLSSVDWAMKAVNMERRATIPAIKIYGRSGSCHLFAVHCVLVEKSCDEACSIMMLFKSVQSQDQCIAESPHRISARSRYNFIAGLELHASMTQSISSGAALAPTPRAESASPSSAIDLSSGHDLQASRHI